MTKIKEIFKSIQGEGPYIGYEQLFVRFCKCNLKCGYCDTDFLADDKTMDYTHDKNLFKYRPIQREYIKDRNDLKLHFNGNFDNVCFTGMETEWLILVAYVFQMWCISLHKYSDCLPVAIFMTYLMEKVAFRLRVYYGEKNVARKAVIDNRFL